MSTDPVAAVSVGAGSAPALEPIVLGAPSHPPTAQMSSATKIKAGLWRFAVRFGAIYAVIFLLGRVVGLIPGVGAFGGMYYRFWRGVVPWVGQHVLHLERPVSLAPSGSGDKLFDWLQVATMLGVAFVGAAIWVWFDRKRRADGVINELVRIAIRYSLGATMLSYGISKVLREQMPEPSMSRLLQTYGESSPMGLLWTFMGQSWAYSAFAGGLEMLGGLLLFFRRTTTLGALLLVAVMANVLMMNLAFDVPVKLYSAHYLAFAAVLAARDFRRLAHVLLLHRPTQPGSLGRGWPRGRAAKLLGVVKLLIVAWILWTIPTQRIWRFVEAPPRVKPEYFGMYEVVSFSRNGRELPPLTTDTQRWRRVAIDEQNRITILLMTDARMVYRLRPGPGPGKVTLEAMNAPRASVRETFTLTRAETGELNLEGRWFGAQVSMQLRRADERRMLLRDRGFHWISEQPFNR